MDLVVRRPAQQVIHGIGEVLLDEVRGIYVEVIFKVAVKVFAQSAFLIPYPKDVWTGLVFFYFAHSVYDGWGVGKYFKIGSRLNDEKTVRQGLLVSLLEFLQKEFFSVLLRICEQGQAEKEDRNKNFDNR